MSWMEAVLLVLGVGAFVVSFCLPEKKENKEQEIDLGLIREIVDKEMADAKERVSEVVDETLEYAVEKTERASERISNEKIMAISEYSETVLADMNKTHQEIMFLYDMLNDKHKNLKETVQKVDKKAKEAEEKANAAASVLAAKEKITEVQSEEVSPEPKSKAKTRKIRQIDDTQQSKKDQAKEQRITLDMLESVIPKPQDKPNVTDTSKTVEFQPFQPQGVPEVKEFSFAEQAPHIERPVKQEAQAVSLENAVSIMKEEQIEEQEPVQENNNDKILRLHKEGKSSVAIAKELGLGVGEVKLVINLFKGA